MALFSNFKATFRFTEFFAVTASSALTTNLRAELVTSGNWTEPIANRFKSPPDGDGRFVEIVVTEPSAVRWQWVVLNDVGATVCTREVLLSGAGETVRAYSGDDYVWFEVNKGATNDEAVGCGLLDLSPESQTAHVNYTWGRGHRNSVGTSDGQGDVVSEFFHADNGVYATARRMMAHRRADGAEIQMVTFSGQQLHMPCELEAVNASAQSRPTGRIFNFLRTFVGSDNTFTMEIGDAGETATFRSVGVNADSLIRLAIRSA